jgi:hypothetical protein
MPENLIRKKPLVFGLLALALATGASINAYAQYAAQLPPNLYAALTKYGFSADQKSALRTLMKNSGIQNADELLDQRTNNLNELNKAIISLVQVTQHNFMRRSGKQEIWDVETPAWMKYKPQDTLKLFSVLSMVDPVIPNVSHTDAICILGATRLTMDKRIKYTEELYASNTLISPRVILLAGERYVTPDTAEAILDGSPEYLQALALSLGKPADKIIETDLILDLFAGSSLRDKVTMMLIDTPQRNGQRPTTESTVTDLCDKLKQTPDIKHVVFVSSQPYVAYQRAIIQHVFAKNNLQITFDVIGSRFDPSVVKTDADRVNELLQALGSKIWAETPAVMQSIGFDASDQQLLADYRELYVRQPLIYNQLPKPGI